MLFNFKRGTNGRLYWVFENEDEAMKVFWAVRILRFFGRRCYMSCFGGYMNAWEV